MMVCICVWSMPLLVLWLVPKKSALSWLFMLPTGLRVAGLLAGEWTRLDGVLLPTGLRRTGEGLVLLVLLAAPGFVVDDDGEEKEVVRAGRLAGEGVRCRGASFLLLFSWARSVWRMVSFMVDVALNKCMCVCVCV